MSDYIIKIIPINPYYHIDGQKISKIVDDLKTRITADHVELNILNPLNELSYECLSYIQELLGTPIRCIQAHI